MKEIRQLLVLTLFWTCTQQLKLPDYIKPCQRFDPNVNACAIKSAKEALPHVINGDPKYKVPALDPVIIKELVITEGSSSVGLTMAAHDALMRGIKDVDLRNITIDFQNSKMAVDMFFPQLHIDLIYNVSGRVLLLPIEGYGNGTIDLNKVKADYTFYWEIKKKKDGHDYVIPVNPKLQFQPENVHIHLENLFNGNKLLGDNMNNFMNENWKEILKDVGPVLGDGLGNYIQQVLNGIFQVVPTEHIFLRDSV